jgi:hypothetical protein
MASITIESTTDYRQFKLMGGNRAVDYNHVKRLKGEMEIDPDMFSSEPMVVNENMYVVDGQHRLKAAEELNLPVYYIVRKGATVDMARRMNVTQKSWQLMDFAKSFAEGGNMDYVQFIRTANEFKNIAPGIVMKYLLGGQKHMSSTDFRRGNFKIADLDQAVEWLKRLDEISHLTHVKINTPMAFALMQVFKSEDNNGEFEWSKFYKKLQLHEGARQLFNPASSVRNCLRSIEDVFNFMSGSRVRLY